MQIDLRYETKFSVSSLNSHEIENIIKAHPAMFHEIYYKRNINNIYFDNFDLTSYKDNIEGERDRKKIRIRWYGDLFGQCNNPILEIKYKTGLLGWKERHKLRNFTLDRKEHFDHRKIFDHLSTGQDFDIMKLDLQFMTPTLLNRYERTYYSSFDKKYRVTLDNKMEFYSINPIGDYFETFSDEEKTVVELKYNQHFADGARRITSSFPFRVTKNSKYVIGVERLRNWN
ncbi:polyphosphate polymerase domain-containing protein [Candidatus Thioglobus sp.]|nr:polyphosphate polymerase domain-containing protein [Candidatus Thioglobus sp.]